MSKGAIVNSIIGVVILIIVGSALFLNKRPGEYNAFAQCIAEKEAVFYGAWWCSACTRQKSMFGRDAKALPYLECSGSAQGSLDNPVCKEKNITATPTWEFKNNPNRYHFLSRESLAYLTQCPLSLAGETNLEDQKGLDTIQSILGQLGDYDADVYTAALREQFGVDPETVSGTEIARIFSEMSLAKEPGEEKNQVIIEDEGNE